MITMAKLKFLRVMSLSITAFLTIPAYAAEAEKTPGQPVTSFAKVAAEIDYLFDTNIYDPKVLLSPAFRDIQIEIQDLSIQAQSESEFIDGFNQLWKNGPFSHVNLANSAQTAEQMAVYFDDMNVGGNGVNLEFQQGTAVLTVNTMMGQDTIKQIEEAYQQIAEKGPDNLIIDLRNNEGGAFAVVPLVSHLLAQSLDAGVFLSHNYALNHSEPPSAQAIDKLLPWQGWSISSFWHDAESNGVTRIRFEPEAPVFSGPVYVLVSHKTASAAELASEAMRASGRAKLIGEQTAGAMLSQKPYDLTNGWILFLPFADYVATHSGRIEGSGLQPDIATTAGLAMEKALEEIAAKTN